MRRPLSALLALVVGVLVLARPVTQAASSPPGAADGAVAGGHFFSQGNGQGGGFVLSDDGGAAFWSAFQKMGGVGTLGSPVSQRAVWQGFLVQATQRQVLQWHPELGRALLVNSYDVLHDQGKDDWLAATRQIPPPAPTDADTGLAWALVAARHLAYLDADPAIKAAYEQAAGEALLVNGLPMSPVTRVGPFAVVRCQRTAIRHRLVDDPVTGARAGAVEVLYGSEDVRAAGLLPAAALQPVAAPGSAAPTGTAVATAATPTGTAAARGAATDAAAATGAAPASPARVGETPAPSAAPGGAHQATAGVPAATTAHATAAGGAGPAARPAAASAAPTLRAPAAPPSATRASAPAVPKAAAAPPAAPAAAPAAPPAAPAAPAPSTDREPAAPSAPAGHGPEAGGFAYGFQAHMYFGQAGPALWAVQAAGFGWVKQQVEWKAIQPNGPGDQGWGDLDAIVAAANAQHIRLLLSVVQAPAWAAVAPGQPYPKDPATAAAFVGALASRYQGRVGAIEIWNEENFAREVGRGDIDAGRYVELLKACFRAIRAADPSILVVSGAPTPTGVNDPNIAIDDNSYLQQMYAYQGGIVKGYFDVLGAHAEAWANPPEATVGSPEPANVTGFNNHPSFFFRRLEDYRRTMLAAGDGKKPVWETEFGYDSCPDPAPAPPGYEYCKLVTEQQQADYLVRAFKFARANYPWLGGIFVWNLNFQHFSPPGDEKWGFGVLRANYSPRPAYLALQRMVRGDAVAARPVAAALGAAVAGEAAAPAGVKRGGPAPRAAATAAGHAAVRAVTPAAKPVAKAARR